MTFSSIPTERVDCPICKRDRSEFLFETRGQKLRQLYIDGDPIPVREPGRIVRCRGCGLVYVNPRIVDLPGLQSYTVEQEKAYFEATQRARRVAFQGLLPLLEGYLGGTGSLLDVGFGDGLLLAMGREAGWEVWGVEVSEPLVEWARSTYGLEQLYLGRLREAGYPTGRFDGVALINVLEHLRDPASMVEEIARILRPGGVVAVHTLNVNSLEARLRGPRWRHMEPYEHFFYFTRRTLGGLLEKMGLGVVGSFGLRSISWPRRVGMWLTQRMQLHWDNGLGLVARRGEG